MEDNRRGGNGRRDGRRDYGSRRDSDRRPSSDRPRRSFGGGSSDRPRRSFGESDERRSYGSDRPRRTYSEGGDRPQRRTYGEGGDRPQRRTFGEGGDRPRRPRISGDRPAGTDRPRRSYGEGSERRTYGGDRPQRRTYGDRPERRGYGDRTQQRRPAGRKDFSHFRSEEESGISKMISRRPQLDADFNSDNDMVMAPIKEVVRLNKFIANSGVCSRREADNFILAGVVTVNGEVVTELGTKVNIVTDDIRFNGERLKGESKVYIVMNKPKGYVTTASDPHADKTVMDLLKGCPTRVFPVGRLDKNTTGVLMFTNDGEIAEKLTHPSYDKKKIYQVSLDSKLRGEDYDKILSGIELSDGMIAADELEYIEEDDHRKLGIEIHSGKNRIVRRIFESLGYEVKALDRVYFAGLTKKGLKRGEWRFLSEGEINLLRMGAYL
ncbi:MAG: pseudouridine synthase [Bacteroidales bacterium]|nr:pseudouridine synthase [Bacteroidales bacterium]